jgi:uncharacterized protein YjbJ (UPF0337 family)
MQGDSEFDTLQRSIGLRAAAAQVERERRRASAQARRAASALSAAATGDHLTTQERFPTMRSARQDTLKGTIDKLAARVLEAYGRLTGNRSAGTKGKAARVRGTARSAKGRLKRHMG